MAISQFHSVRYYPFTLLIIPVVHYFTNIVFTNSSISSNKKYILIILLAFTPGLFHMINFVYLFFWITILFIYFLVNLYKNKIENISYFHLISKNRKSALTGAIIIILSILFLVSLIHFLKGRLYFSSHNLEFMPGLLSFYFSSKFMIYDVIFIILLIFSFINIRKFTKIESSLFITSFGLIIFCFIGFSIMGGEVVISHASRYFLFLYPVIITILSLMLSLLSRTIINFLPNFSLKEIIVFCMVAFIFIFINYPKFEENERRLPGNKKLLEEFNNVTKQYNNLVFVTSGNSHYFFNYFPHNKAYLYRDFKEINESNIIKDDFYKSASGYIKNIGGEIYVGTQESFCRMLQENKNNVIYFFDVLPELRSKLNKIYTGNPMSAKYLIAMLCCNNDSEKTQNALNVIKEQGLFDEEYAKLGIYLYNHDLINECIQAFLKALSINPNNPRYSGKPGSFIFQIREN